MCKTTIILHFDAAANFDLLSNFALALHGLSKEFSFVVARTHGEMAQSSDHNLHITAALRTFVSGADHDDVLARAMKSNPRHNYAVLTHNNEMIMAANDKQIPVLTFGVTNTLPNRGGILSTPENAVRLIKDLTFLPPEIA